MNRPPPPFYTQPFFKFGLPFLVMMVSGAYGLSEFTSTRYEKYEIEVSKFSKEQLSHLEKAKRPFDMQAELERLNKEIDYDNWENVRVERPKGLEESLKNNNTD
eukprot:CFRG0408T1